LIGFFGQYTVLMDEKGRIALPAKLRPLEPEDFKSGITFMLTKGLDGCLALYPEKQWQLIQQQLDTVTFTRKDFRYFNRLLYSGAVPVNLDRQGRMLVPAHLQEAAGLNREVLIIGANRWIELWNPKRYQEYLDQYGQSYEEVAEKLFDINRQSGE
jgi:MraZ protein